MSLIRLHLVLFCALSLACQSESPKTHVGVWELSEQGHLIRLELTASGSARMTVDDEEVLGNRADLETRYEIDTSREPHPLRILVRAPGYEAMRIGMLISVAEDEMIVRTFFDGQVPASLGDPGDDTRRVFRRVRGL